MYNFIDVNQALEENVLPSEALKINGLYIEDQINGYRTLNVTGREALSPDVVTFETGIRDGTRMKSKRYPERIIIVTYQIIANSNEEFRAAYNKLGRILDVKDAKLIFNDEPDKYFIGTPCAIGSVPPGRNAVVGEIEFLCTDPFKYSIAEYVATAADGENSVSIYYEGTYKSFPKLEAAFYKETEVNEDGSSGELTGNGDCGFVAFFNDNEKIIQLGDPEEVDGEETPEPSQTVVNQTFLSEQAWSADAQALWNVNGGQITGHDTEQAGSLHMAAASYSDTPVSGRTSGSMLSGAGTYPMYSVHYETKNRTKTTVDVTFTVFAYVDSVEACGITAVSELTAAVTINGVANIIVLKKYGENWSSGRTYSKSQTVTVDGLYHDDQIHIVNNYLRVQVVDAYSSAALPVTSCNPIVISPYQTAAYANYYLTPSDFGSVVDKWHGPSISRAIDGGAVNFTLTYKQKMCIGSESGSIGQFGSFWCWLTDASGANVAGVRVYKNVSGKSGTVAFYVNGSKVYSTTIDLSNSNALLGSNEHSVQASTIIKSGNQFSFSVAGIKETFEDDSAAKTAVTKVTFMFEQYSTNAALAYNGLYWVKFVKDTSETYRDVPNKFSANDIVVADCKNAEIYLNGVSAPDLGALGNDWEGFYLTPGGNNIGFSFSEWVTAEYAPKIRIIYREVFL